MRVCWSRHRALSGAHFSVHLRFVLAYGFEESWLNGQRAVGHGGDWRGFESTLVLFPELGWGVFASANGMFDAFAFYTAFGKALADHYLPAPRPPRLTPPADFAARAGRYTGSYLLNRRIRGDFMKLGQLIMHARVEANEEGGLTLSTPGAALAVCLVEVEPDLFATRTRSATRTSSSSPTPARSISCSAASLPRSGAWWQSPRLHAAAGGAAALLLAGTLGGWGSASRPRFAARGAEPHLARRAARGSAVALLFLFGLGVIAFELRPERFPDLLIEVPGLLRAGFAALSLAALLALALPVLAWRSVWPGTKAPLARFHYALLAAAGLLLGAQTLYWRIFGAGIG